MSKQAYDVLIYNESNKNDSYKDHSQDMRASTDVVWAESADEAAAIVLESRKSKCKVLVSLRTGRVYCNLIVSED